MIEMDRVVMMKMLAAEKFHRFYIYTTGSQVLQVGCDKLAPSNVFR
jgi:hypothetical protein